MAHDIFISYSSHDKVVADAVCAVLEAKKIRCWIAPRDILPGMRYGAAIVQAIPASKVMILVFSGSANSSEQVMNEVERAVSTGVPVLPFRIEDVQPSDELELFIKSRHWLDAMTPPMEAHLDRLAESVGLLLSSAVVTERAAEMPAAPGPEAAFRAPVDATTADCPKCGRHNIPDALFCATCGTSLAPASQAAPVSVSTPATAAGAVETAVLATDPTSAVTAEALQTLTPPATTPVQSPPLTPQAPVFASVGSTPAATAASTIACPRCGRQNEAAALFCEDCGTGLQGAAAQNVAAQQQTNRQEPQRFVPSIASMTPVSFGKRLAAYLIDTVIYIILWFILVVAAVAIFGEDGAATDTTMAIGIFVIYFLYHYVSSLKNCTIGMDILSLRMVDQESGAPLPKERAAMRAFMITLGTTVAGLGLLNALWDSNKQTWHDKAAKSFVVSTK